LSARPLEAGLSASQQSSALRCSASLNRAFIQ
jgi:hypothetical protein